MDIIEAFQPDMYQVLCDGDTNTTSSKRRVQKSVDRSITFFERCIKRHEKSEVKAICTSHRPYQDGVKLSLALSDKPF
jgi:queuine/archaeosine tRNA-ribosyltransferase